MKTFLLIVAGIFLMLHTTTAQNNFNYERQINDYGDYMQANAVATNAQKQTYIGGYSGGCRDILLTKLDSNGTLIWQKTYDFEQDSTPIFPYARYTYAQITDLKILPNQHVLAVGYGREADDTFRYQGGFVIEFDTNGNKISEKAALNNEFVYMQPATNNRLMLTTTNGKTGIYNPVNRVFTNSINQNLGDIKCLQPAVGGYVIGGDLGIKIINNVGATLSTNINMQPIVQAMQLPDSSFLALGTQNLYYLNAQLQIMFIQNLAADFSKCVDFVRLPNGDVFVAGQYMNGVAEEMRVKKITPQGIITTFMRRTDHSLVPQKLSIKNHQLILLGYIQIKDSHEIFIKSIDITTPAPVIIGKRDIAITNFEVDSVKIITFISGISVYYYPKYYCKVSLMNYSNVPLSSVACMLGYVGGVNCNAAYSGGMVNNVPANGASQHSFVFSGGILPAPSINGNKTFCPYLINYSDASIDIDNNNNGGYNTTCRTIYVNAVSTQEVIKNTIKMYPNPATNALNIETNSDFGVVGLEIMDLLGKKILIANINTAQTTIDINDWKQGVYVAKFMWADGTTYMQKVVKN